MIRKTTKHEFSDFVVMHHAVKFNDQRDKKGNIRRAYFNREGKCLGVILNWRKYFVSI